MSHDQGQLCVCVSEHRPAPLELAAHHVWPSFMGGPDTVDNLIWLCPTTHINVHEILREMVKDGRLTYTQVAARQSQPVNRYAYATAVRGYDLSRGTG